MHITNRGRSGPFVKERLCFSETGGDSDPSIWDTAVPCRIRTAASQAPATGNLTQITKGSTDCVWHVHRLPSETMSLFCVDYLCVGICTLVHRMFVCVRAGVFFSTRFYFSFKNWNCDLLLHIACLWESAGAKECVKRLILNLKKRQLEMSCVSQAEHMKWRGECLKRLVVGEVVGLLFGLKLGTLIPLIPLFYCQLFPSCRRICTECRICAPVHHSILYPTDTALSVLSSINTPTTPIASSKRPKRCLFLFLFALSPSLRCSRQWRRHGVETGSIGKDLAQRATRACRFTVKKKSWFWFCLFTRDTMALPHFH